MRSYMEILVLSAVIGMGRRKPREIVALEGLAASATQV
jgi:hypothetical protein